MKETLTYCRYTDRQDAMCKLSGRGVLVMGGPSLISVDVCVCVWHQHHVWSMIGRRPMALRRILLPTRPTICPTNATNDGVSLKYAEAT